MRVFHPDLELGQIFAAATLLEITAAIFTYWKIFARSSGVSYMIENREVTKRIIPDLFENQSILPVDDYPAKLYEMLIALSPRKIRRPSVVVLTPGIYNSAYFEHAFLAQGMGAQLVEGSDLFVAEDECVYMRTVDGQRG